MRRVCARLIDYESDLYERIEVVAALQTGERLSCQAYVLPRSRRDFASDAAWDPEHFARTRD